MRLITRLIIAAIALAAAGQPLDLSPFPAGHAHAAPSHVIVQLITCLTAPGVQPFGSNRNTEYGFDVATWQYSCRYWQEYQTNVYSDTGDGYGGNGHSTVQGANGYQVTITGYGNYCYQPGTEGRCNVWEWWTNYDAHYPNSLLGTCHLGARVDANTTSGWVTTKSVGDANAC